MCHREGVTLKYSSVKILDDLVEFVENPERISDFLKRIPDLKWVREDVISDNPFASAIFHDPFCGFDESSAIERAKEMGACDFPPEEIIRTIEPELLSNSDFFFAGERNYPSVWLYSFPAESFYFNVRERLFLGMRICRKGKRGGFEYETLDVYDSLRKDNSTLREKFMRLLGLLKKSENVTSSLGKYYAGSGVEGDDIEISSDSWIPEPKEELSYFDSFMTRHFPYGSHEGMSKKEQCIRFLNNLDADEDVKEAIAMRLANWKDDAFDTSNDTADWMGRVMMLPWNLAAGDKPDIRDALRMIDSSHYGMREVKRRIKETVTLIAASGKPQSVAICLDGPPGVGKTSIARSIAKALGRKFANISVPSLASEHDVVGDRENYKAAGPGRIMKALIDTASNDPVILLDEIDKAPRGGGSERGPLPSLLEILESEQRRRFRDVYFDFPFDLSNVIFILTSNDLSKIPETLLDRIEVISVPGYSTDEKKHIAMEYLIPQIQMKFNVTRMNVSMSSRTAEYLVDNFCPEAGVRSLKRHLEKMIANHICSHMEQGKEIPDLKITKKTVDALFGKVCIRKLKADVPGTSLGLACYSSGCGVVLRIEVVRYPGSGKLVLTGNLGETIRESINVAFSFMRNFLSSSDDYDSFFGKNDFHVNIPSGGIPKDGPSAGAAFITAFYSLYSGKVIKKNMAMTGEVNLSGEILAVGGIDGKIKAAVREGNTDIVIPAQNECDYQKIRNRLKGKAVVHLVSNAFEVFDIAF